MLRKCSPDISSSLASVHYSHMMGNVPPPVVHIRIRRDHTTPPPPRIRIHEHEEEPQESGERNTENSSKYHNVNEREEDVLDYACIRSREYKILGGQPRLLIRVIRRQNAMYLPTPAVTRHSTRNTFSSSNSLAKSVNGSFTSTSNNQGATSGLSASSIPHQYALFIH